VSLKDYEGEIYTCLRCGFCQAGCPTFRHTLNESLNARGRVILAKLYLTGQYTPDEDYMQRVLSCTLCDICKVKCPPKVEVAEIVEALRSELWRSHRDLYPQDIVESINSILERQNPFGVPREQKMRSYEGESSVLFFVGCSSSVYYPHMAENTLQVLRALGLNPTVLGQEEPCCGYRLVEMGAVDEFKRVASEVVSFLENRGVELVITNCPTCYKTLKEYYKRYTSLTFEVMHITEWLVKEAKFEGELSEPMTVTYHDPCHLGRSMGVYEEPRQLLESIRNLKFVELPKSREESICCGGPIRALYPELASKMSDEVVQGAIEVGASQIVSSCTTCYRSIASSAAFHAEVDALDLPTLLARALRRG